MTLCDYEQYTVFFSNKRFWNSKGQKFYSYYENLICNYNPFFDHSLAYVRTADQSPLISILPEHYGGKDLRRMNFFESKIQSPKPGSTVYFDKACTIPRIKIDNVFKRTTTVANASVIVIPKFSSVRIEDYYCVFKDDDKKFILLLDYEELDVRPQIGETLEALINDNIDGIARTALYEKNIVEASGSNIPLDRLDKKHLRSTLLDFIDMKCIYMGRVAFYSKKQEFIFKILDGIYPVIIPEDEFTMLLGKEVNSFDVATIEGLRAGLSSPDSDIVMTNLRILASLNYEHYPAITKFLLADTERYWRDMKTQFTSAIKFMLKFLDYHYYGSTQAWEIVTPEEFDLAKIFFEKALRESLNNAAEDFLRYTNLITKMTVNIDVSLPSTGITSEIVGDETDDIYEE